MAGREQTALICVVRFLEMCQAECQTKSLDKESRVYHTDYFLEESYKHSIQADVAMTTFTMTRPLRQEFRSMTVIIQMTFIQNSKSLFMKLW